MITPLERGRARIKKVKTTSRPDERDSGVLTYKSCAWVGYQRVCESGSMAAALQRRMSKPNSTDGGVRGFDLQNRLHESTQGLTPT